MEDTTVSIIGVLIASVILFIVPLILIADRSDDISQLVVQTVTAEFIDDVIKSGKITNDGYEKFINSLNSTGNTYEIDMEIKILDKNTAKAVTDKDARKIGNNTYYSIFTSQIEDKIGISGQNIINNSDGKLVLKQGDEISVIVRNESKTFSQALKTFYYNVTGDEIHIITGTASGTIAIDGAT